MFQKHRCFLYAHILTGLTFKHWCSFAKWLAAKAIRLVTSLKSRPKPFIFQANKAVSNFARSRVDIIGVFKVVISLGSASMTACRMLVEHHNTRNTRKLFRHMGSMRKRVPAAMVILIAYQVSKHPANFSVPRAPNAPVSSARASLSDVLAAAGDAMRDPTVQAAYVALGNLQKVTDFFNSLNTAGNVWQNWTGSRKAAAFYKTGDNITKHTSHLIQGMEKAIQGGSNVLISSVQRAQLPSEPVRGTYLEQLMVAVLCDKSPGMSAIYAEAGTGKSVAVLLAAIEVARTKTSDFFVVLQNDLDESLKTFFRLSEVSSAADIATSFFIAMHERKVRLHLIFDNVLDGGVSSDREKDMLKALARGASRHGHQVVFTMQRKEAAESIAELNGDTTYMAELQDKSYGAYRWTQSETVQLIQRLLNGQQQDTNQILADSEIPDEIGRWRPRSTELFIQFGRKPSAPLRSKQAGQALNCFESPTCTGAVFRKPFGSDSFKRTAC